MDNSEESDEEEVLKKMIHKKRNKNKLMKMLDEIDLNDDNDNEE